MLQCSKTRAFINFKTNAPFQGHIFTVGREKNMDCQADYLTNLATTTIFNLPFRQCFQRFIWKDRITYVTNVVFSFHPIVITNSTRIFRIECEQSRGGNKQLRSSSNLPPPCTYDVRAETTHLSEYVTGDILHHIWNCTDPFYS
ncbi:hypothetical protein AB6A40_003901 [Gnathostoma spinigerum]|uniref:ZP domain-containing protein n=1 Tax=Gnathostoma spinigerum TaxID=75299 RepID=A0ABD6EKG2_9BILA